LGLIAGILDLIPSLGPTLAAILAVAIAFLEGSAYLPVSNFFFALIVLGIYLVVQQVENIWIRPALMGRRLRLHPALIFVGVFGSLAMFGILAALVVIPVMSSIGVIGRYIMCRMQGINPYPDNTLSRTTIFDDLESPVAIDEPPLPEKLAE
jgi:predicted PurR-regulated permease PerM